MDRQLRYHPLFNSDVVAAADWYDKRSLGLGDSFTTNVKLTVGAAHNDPTRYSPSPLGVYYYRVDRFPYYVLFDVTDLEILILGVLHTSRSIPDWLKTRG